MLLIIWESEVTWAEVKSDYVCAGTRVGIGSDTTHGTGNPSLQSCAESALSDSRCDGSGYFDATGSGSNWQCKCATTNDCMVSSPWASGWKIYQADDGGNPSFCLLYQISSRVANLYNINSNILV